VAKEGKIIPRPGVDEEFDSAQAAVMEVEAEAAEHLNDVSKTLSIRVVYFGSDKRRFQLEVPESVRVPGYVKPMGLKLVIKKPKAFGFLGFFGFKLWLGFIRLRVLIDAHISNCPNRKPVPSY
jgi:hypothetical protein